MSLLLLLRSQVAAPPPPVVVPAVRMPSPVLRIGFTGSPRDPTIAMTDVSSDLRAFRTARGRSFEFDRMETGTAETLLDNRDSNWNPENTAGIHYPLKPYRRLELAAVWNSIEYPLFAGFSEGYPQEYPGAGFDATVRLRASDPFYVLSRLKFPPGTAFPVELSGSRISRCLTIAGIDPTDTDLDTGQSLIAAVTLDTDGAGSLDGQPVLEHLLLVAEAENGRFFAAADGRLTFLDRDQRRRQLTSLGTFGASGYQFAPMPAPTHDESKLFNLIRLRLPDGSIVEAEDTVAISETWESTFEKEWPLADSLEATAAAHYVLGTLGVMRLRIPELELRPLRNPSVMWPVVFGIEIGQRWTFELQPRGGGDPIDRDVIVDGISHEASMDNWIVRLRLTLADERVYWRLGVVGASEVATTARLGY